MRPHQSLPRLWLMTDERVGEALWSALARLPRGSGVVFRHYRTEADERRRLYDRAYRIARRRRLVLMLAGTPRQAIAWRADGAHGRSPHRYPEKLLRTVPVHNAREAIAAAKARVDLIFISPVFATQSHPNGNVLGAIGLGRLARSIYSERQDVRLIVLGGMDATRFRRLGALDAYGWAAIDALTLSPDQKRKVVPR